MMSIEDINEITKKAAELKDLANSRNDYFEFFPAAQKLYDEAYKNCQNSNLISKIQKDFLSTIYLFESLDCQYSYSLKKNEFDRCLVLSSMQSDIIDGLFAEYDLKDIAENEIRDWYLSLKNHKISSEFKSFFAIGKSYFEAKNFKKALFYFRRTEEVFDRIDKTNFDDRFLTNFNLNVFILKFNISQCQLGILPSVTLNKDFLERQILKELLKSYNYAVEVSNYSDDPHYITGRENIIRVIDKIISRSINEWQVLIDYTHSDILLDRMLEVNYKQVQKIVRFDQSSIIRKTDYFLFYTHGFNTRGEWKNDLTEVISSMERDTNIHFVLLP